MAETDGQFALVRLLQVQQRLYWRSRLGLQNEVIHLPEQDMLQLARPSLGRLSDQTDGDR